MKKSRILFITYGSTRHSSSRIRAIEYMPLLEKDLLFRAGLIYRIPKKDGTYDKIVFPFLKRFRHLYRNFSLFFFRYDLVFIQREFIHPFLIRKLKKRGTRIVYDFDDAIYLNTARQPRNHERFLGMITGADRVIVSSPVLAEYCRSFGIESVIITTPVDFEKIRKKEDYQIRGKFNIGWIGSASTTPFLEQVREPLAELSGQTPVKLTLIGAKPGFSLPGVETVVIPWSANNEQELLKTFDAGIMPLPDSDFARGKGGYKLYLYMAAGVPVIATPLGINREIVRHGINGFHASRPSEWIEALLLLIGNASLRENLGKQGMQDAEQLYDRKIGYGKIREIFISLLNHEPFPLPAEQPMENIEMKNGVE